jgi:hypothetical protein
MCPSMLCVTLISLCRGVVPPHPDMQPLYMRLDEMVVVRAAAFQKGLSLLVWGACAA